MGKKSTFSWNVIKVEWESGQSSTALSKKYPVTRQAIDRKAQREGWQRTTFPIVVDGTLLDKAKRLDLVTVGRGDLVKRSPENIAKFLQLIQQGSSQKLAAQAVGFHETSIPRLKKEYPEFNEAVGQVRAQFLAKHIAILDRAGERDWKASYKILETAPETRNEFGKGKGTDPVEFTFSFERAPYDTKPIRDDSDDDNIIDVDPEDDSNE